MLQRKYLDDFLRGRNIGRLECERTQLEVSEELGITQRVISRLWQRIEDDGNVSRCYGTGRPRVTTPNEDRYIFGSYCQKKQTEHSIRPVSSALFSYRYAVSRQTVYRRLGHIGLYVRRPVRCVPLTATHCRLRLTWSREHALWTPQQWSCVMFSDESRKEALSGRRQIQILQSNHKRVNLDSHSKEPVSTDLQLNATDINLRHPRRAAGFRDQRLAGD
ncbi:transposable element Tcb1 transposase [Trichonephila clavipes]|nr:transposable element Tcb1 transposase [Trichonephila clavipes]